MPFIEIGKNGVEWTSLDVGNKNSIKHVQFEVLLRYTNKSFNYIRLELPEDIGAKNIHLGVISM